MDPKMIYDKSIVIFLLISTRFGIEYAFNVEEIIGGYPAAKSDFKYQAAIVGKYNFSYSSYLLCSAGILSDNFLISAVRCFVDSGKELKKLKFFATVTTDILITKDLPLQEIDYIYTYYDNEYSIDQNLALVWLRDSLDLQNNVNLAFLQIPHRDEVFYGQSGLVAGFGIDSIHVFDKHQSRQQIRIPFRVGLVLRYAFVSIINPGELSDNDLICDRFVGYFSDLCGIILPDETYNYRGICMGDYGAPLVIDNKVVGIATIHRKDCDDSIDGTVYTMVTKYKDFIDGLLAGSAINGTYYYKNNGHIGNPKYRDFLATTS